MPEKRRFDLRWTTLMNLGAIYALIIWAGRDLAEELFCAACLAVFYGCVVLLQISHRAALAELAEDDDEVAELSLAGPTSPELLKR
jgi:hypothetical protein